MGPGCVHVGAGAQEKQKPELSSSFSVLLSHSLGELPRAAGQSHHSTHTSWKGVLVPPGVSHHSFQFFCVPSPRADLLRCGQ